MKNTVSLELLHTHGYNLKDNNKNKNAHKTYMFKYI